MSSIRIPARLNNVQVSDCFDLQSGLDARRVEKLVAHVNKTGWNLPPIIVVQDGSVRFEILDGHHRIAAARLLKLFDVQAWIVPARDYDRLLEEKFRGAPRGFLIEALAYIDCGGITAVEVGNDLTGINLPST